MKTTRVFLFMLGTMLLGSPAMMAQSGRYGTGPDSIECRNNLSFYREYVRAKDLASAVSPWRTVLRLCPRGASVYPWADGEFLVKDFLMVQPGVTPERRKLLIDTLMLIYDTRIQHFPSSASTGLLKKIFDMQQYRPEQEELRVSDIEAYLNMTGNNANANALIYYMDLTGKLYAQGKRNAEEVMNAYSRITGILEQQEAQNGVSQQTDNAKTFTENVFIASGVASCENLTALFTPRFEANPEDLELVAKIVSMLSTSNCEGSDLFVQSVTALNKLDPSYKTAFYLSRLHASKGEMDLAVQYLEESVNSPDISMEEKGANMVELGGLYLRANNSNKAMAMAKNAMELNTAVRGRAYLLMASIWAWAAQRCGENDIEKRAPFWVAADFALKAKQADPACAEEADKLTAQYRQYFPLQEEAFMYDIMDGSSYTVTCSGLRETTTVRTRK